MKIPSRPYIALYGSHSGDWRAECRSMLDERGIPWYDPTDLRWRAITEETGDAQQRAVNRLVAKQHRALLGATCVVFHLAARHRDDGHALTSFAARSELGFLIGRGIQTFACIESDIEGRNYIWGAMRLYPHMVRCRTLADATRRAGDYFFGATQL